MSKKTLSLALRERVVAAVSSGMSRRQAAERFGVSPVLGAVGDIVLADLSQLQLIQRNMKAAISADAQFPTQPIVFRFTMKVDGAPLWASPIIHTTQQARARRS